MTEKGKQRESRTSLRVNKDMAEETRTDHGCGAVRAQLLALTLISARRMAVFGQTSRKRQGMTKMLRTVARSFVTQKKCMQRI
jgi:hypothetical protein